MGVSGTASLTTGALSIPGSVSATALEQGDEELDEDEVGQDPGRED